MASTSRSSEALAQGVQRSQELFAMNASRQCLIAAGLTLLWLLIRLSTILLSFFILWTCLGVALTSYT